jgi:predicted membrane protein
MSEHRHNNSSRIFWGLVLILIGVLVLFERFGFHDLGHLLSTWWPAIFILIGISILLGNGFRDPGAGLFFIIFGGFFLLRELDILEYDAWHYIWPAGLIALGLWIILRPAFRHRGVEGIPTTIGNDLELTCVFSGVKRRVESAAFKGGQVTAVFGGAEVDFSRAGLDGGKAMIEATAIFGGVNIIVPRDWKVVVDGTPILGGFEEKHRNPPEAEAKATLYVRGTSIFGGITVKD